MQAPPNPSRFPALRTENQRQFLDLIRRGKAVSRAELTRITGVTSQASSNIMSRLVDLGLVREVSKRTGARGYPAKLYTINETGAYSFGVHIEQGLLSVLCLNLKGAVVAQITVETKAAAPEWVMDRAAQEIAGMADEAGLDRSCILGVGLSFPGRFDSQHAKVIPPKSLQTWKHIAMPDALAHRVQLPVIWENDATAGAAGYAFLNPDLRAQQLLYVQIGRGIGAGLISAGKLIRGVEGNAGEIGRILVSTGPDQGSARLSQIASTTSLKKALGLEANNTLLPDHLKKLAQHEEKLLEEWIDNAADAIAQALEIATYMLDVSTIVLGGELPAEVLQRMCDQARSGLRDKLYRWNRPPEVIHNETDSNTVAFGAAILPITRAFSDG